MQDPIRVVEYGEQLSLRTALRGSLTATEQVLWYAELARANIDLQMHLKGRTSPLEVVLTPNDVLVRVVGAAGELSVRGLRLSVLPKFAPTERTERWQSVMLRMLQVAHSRDFELASAMRLREGGMSLLDQLGLSFADSLTAAARRGPLLMYQSRQVEATVLKGRFLPLEQLRRFQPHLVVSETDVLEADNPITRLLSWSAEYLARNASLLRVAERIRAARAGLIGIPPIPPAPSVAARIRLPRASSHYEAAVRIARALAVARPQTHGGGTFTTYGVVFNTERSFELLVSAIILRVTALLGGGLRSLPQAPSQLASASGGGQAPFQVWPDDQIRRGSKTVVAIDAKYKSGTTEGVLRPSPDDFRQALASALATKASEALLIYPVAGDVAYPLATWGTAISEIQTIRVHALGLPLMWLADTTGVDRMASFVAETLTSSRIISMEPPGPSSGAATPM